MKMYFSLLLAFLFLTSVPVFAYSTDDYFQAVEQINKLPTDSTPVLPCNLAEKQQIVAMLKSNKEYAGLKLDKAGGLIDQWNEDVEIYKGYFSNNGVLEYAFVFTGGTMHANTVKVFKRVNNQLEDVHLDRIIVNNLFPGADMSRFYLHVANPFAIVKNGKTYLRFMEYPYKEYNKTKLLLCNYLWEDNKFILTGPNLSFTGPNGSLIEAKKAVLKQNTINEPYCYESLEQ